jgi:exodeoxyribonuclease-3
VSSRSRAGSDPGASLYLPNGNPVGTDKYAYKFAWMERLEAYAKARLAAEEMVVLAGDYNVIPEPIDARYPRPLGRGRALPAGELAPGSAASSISGSPAPSAPVRTSSATTPSGTTKAGAWQRNNGIRIDHQLLSPLAADRLKGAQIDKRTRSWDKPSDHVPVNDRAGRCSRLRVESGVAARRAGVRL